MGEADAPKPAAANGGNTQGTSTSSAGPAGAHFEGQVGAFYLLAMLAGAPPRGLPGTTIERIALQQANEGRALDDVIVHARDASGNEAVLEIQVKREITFAPTDRVFRKVVTQVVSASRRADFFETRYELAIATAKRSLKIDGAYQDVLMLARQVGNAAAFVARLALAGAANDDMRKFVSTFRGHLRTEGAPDDDAMVWQLLRRLQIIAFDFTASASASADHALERAAHILHSDDVSRAGALWANLIEQAIEVARSGGDRTRERLLESLAPQNFRFAGDRRYAAARAALSEASRLALADIRNRVGRVGLSRQERVEAVREALDRGRYVEIKGDAGVGKSGVLRQFAEQIGLEGQAVVLSPGRCEPRGWVAMRAQLGFDGSVRELLVELANDGGAVLFVDNLDFFSDEERLTVIDLIREASTVSGVSVVTTARQGVDVDEPRWLPDDAIELLGRTAPVVIEELSDGEVGQLRIGDEALVPLLVDDHPARQITRNLFRLARLASRTQTTDPVPRTEVDMAEQWWKSADGAADAGLRDRMRLLQDAAEQTLGRADFLEVRGRASAPIDALVTSGTLRNLASDKVAFRHDVFREWAVANALCADPGLFDRLDLRRPVPAMLVRGIELAARMTIERAADGASWRSMLARLSPEGAHPSWRRAAVLALVRSEARGIIVPRAATELLANEGALLRELVRTVGAVEVVPAATVLPPELLRAAGVKLDRIPAGLNVPRGPEWPALILWTLSLGERVPAPAIPDLVELYNVFSIGSLGVTRITPLTTGRLYQWLRLMEPPAATPPHPDEPPPFWRSYDREQMRSVKADLRSGFLMFCKTMPALAAEYLTAVQQSEHSDDLVRSIWKMRGTLAQAAPAELARLTAKALLEPLTQRQRRMRGEWDEPFTFLDHEFLPASPAQGPFFDLLQYAPEHGLRLVQQIVGHAIMHASGGRPAGSNAIELALPGSGRAFPWTQTYFWSRHSHYYSVTSALMALEAWGHRRLDAGEPFERVLTDVLGPPGSSAAFLLVAVDLIISHWPKSADAATAFLGSPELLCLDHDRPIHDQFELPDFFGLKALQSEPSGPTSTADLKRRPSRRVTLDEVIGNYTHLVLPEQRAKLIALLQQAATRLGAPAATATLADPAFMVLHALNSADPANWREVTVTKKDGSTVTGRQYVSPAPEEQHLQALRDAAAPRQTDSSMQTTISLATENPSYLSPEGRLAIVAWAQRAGDGSATTEDADDSHSVRMREEAILTAAMIVMRDGDDALRAKYGEWAHTQLSRAVATPDDDVGRQVRAGLRFNPPAIAFNGLIHALRHRDTPEARQSILRVAASDNPAAAHGLGSALSALNAIDARMPRALLRCALSSCIVANRDWDLPAEEVAARAGRRAQRADAAVAAEMTWLSGAGQEPPWPTFPNEQVRPRRRLRLAGPPAEEHVAGEGPEPPKEHFNHQAGATWLGQVIGLAGDTALDWVADVVRTYMPWTIWANGGQLEETDEIDRAPTEWNNVFFVLAARYLPGLSVESATASVLAPVASLPERHFFDVLAVLLRAMDEVFFDGVRGSMSVEMALAVRTSLSGRLMNTWGWKRLASSKDMSIEMHLGPAAAVLFFNDQVFGHGPKCYLLPPGIDRVDPFLPLISSLTRAAPSPFVALALLNLLEVSPRPAHLDVLVEGARSWLDAYPDFRPFWIDHAIGRRWCATVDKIAQGHPSAVGAQAPVRLALDGIVAVLVTLGIAEASRLEERLETV